METLRVVTGTERCGTTYFARLVNRAGVLCGHEDVYSIRGAGPRGDFVADSSWLAVPWLPLPRVAHLVRNPLHVVNSFLSFGFFTESRFERHRRVVEAVIGRLPDRPEYAAVRYWLDWTAVIDRYAEKTWRLEALPLREVAEFTGAPLDALQAAAKRVPDTVNTARRWPTYAEHPPLRFDRLPSDLRAELYARAAAYGYSRLDLRR